MLRRRRRRLRAAGSGRKERANRSVRGAMRFGAGLAAGQPSGSEPEEGRGRAVMFDMEGRLDVSLGVSSLPRGGQQPVDIVDELVVEGGDELVADAVGQAESPEE